MLRALNKVWWLLALCGIIDAMYAAMNLLMMTPDGSLILRRFAPPNQVWDMSMLALLAGACAIAAGLWSSARGNSWLLSLHGLALAAFGLIGISPLVRGPLSFRPISLLFVLMAVSVGVFALRSARTQQSGLPDKWFLNVSGVVSLAFALSFIAVGFRWLRLEPPHSYWIWMSSYFCLCAIFMLYLALRAYGQRVSLSGPTTAPFEGTQALSGRTEPPHRKRSDHGRHLAPPTAPSEGLLDT